jgi:hypothetical protein
MQEGRALSYRVLSECRREDERIVRFPQARGFQPGRAAWGRGAAVFDFSAVDRDAAARNEMREYVAHFFFQVVLVRDGMPVESDRLIAVEKRVFENDFSPVFRIP